MARLNLGWHALCWGGTPRNGVFSSITKHALSGRATHLAAYSIRKTVPDASSIIDAFVTRERVEIRGAVIRRLESIQ
jgi:hypothetical protein